jgi:membrane protease YdiL (CAAX protease family)
MQLDQLARSIFLKDGRLRPILRALTYLAASFAGTIIVYVFAAAILGIGLTRPAGANFSIRGLYAFEISVCLASVGAALLLRRYLDRRSVASLGLAPRGPWLRLLSIGVLLGAGMQCLVFAIDELLGYSHVTAMATVGQDAAELARYAPLFILVAIGEETSTRGYLFQNLWEEWGVAAAIVLTSIFFAYLHLGNPNSHADVVLTVAGLLAYAVWACLSVLWTKSLWLAIGVHFAWNLFEGPVLGFPVSGIDTGTTMIAQQIAGPRWFTGGPFGPEAGASSIIALAAGLALLYFLHRRGAFSHAFDAREAYARGDLV